MRRFFVNLAIALAIAFTVTLLVATVAVPLVALSWLPSPWDAVSSGMYLVFWFCVFLAALVTLDR